MLLLWDWLKGVIGKVKEMVVFKGSGVFLLVELSVWKFVNMVKWMVMGYWEVLGF